MHRSSDRDRSSINRAELLTSLRKRNVVNRRIKFFSFSIIGVLGLKILTNKSVSDYDAESPFLDFLERPVLGRAREYHRTVLVATLQQGLTGQWSSLSASEDVALSPRLKCRCLTAPLAPLASALPALAVVFDSRRGRCLFLYRRVRACVCVCVHA